MTNQKRDEPPKRYPPIQQDPARRIRRIQRWLGNVSEEFDGIPCYIACHRLKMSWSDRCGCYETIGRICDSCEKRNEIFNRRVDTADHAFADELAWLCREASNSAAMCVEFSTDIANRVRSQVVEREQLRDTIAEQKARIDELEREKCHEYDKENGDEPRNMGNVTDTWELLESFASGLEFELTEQIESL